MSRPRSSGIGATTGIDHRHANASTGQRPDARRPAALLHQVGADGLIRHRHVRDNEVVARERIDLAVIGHRAQCAGWHLQHRTRLELLRDAQPVTRRDARNSLRGSRDDDARGVGVSRLQPQLEISRHPGVV
jgi:hypothetical protein